MPIEYSPLILWFTTLISPDVSFLQLILPIYRDKLYEGLYFTSALFRSLIYHHCYRFSPLVHVLTILCWHLLYNLVYNLISHSFLSCSFSIHYLGRGNVTPLSTFFHAVLTTQFPNTYLFRFSRIDTNSFLDRLVQSLFLVQLMRHFKIQNGLPLWKQRWMLYCRHGVGWLLT